MNVAILVDVVILVGHVICENVVDLVILINSMILLNLVILLLG